MKASEAFTGSVVVVFYLALYGFDLDGGSLEAG